MAMNKDGSLYIGGGKFHGSDTGKAQEQEEYVRDLLERKFGWSGGIITTGKNSKWDIIYPIDHNGPEETGNFRLPSIEAKEDFRGAQSGNTALEQDKLKGSGLEATQADYIVYRIHTGKATWLTVMMRTSLARYKANVLKKFFGGMQDGGWHRDVMGGDNNSTRNLLFYMDEFLKGTTLLETSEQAAERGYILPGHPDPRSVDPTTNFEDSLARFCHMNIKEGIQPGLVPADHLGYDVEFSIVREGGFEFIDVRYEEAEVLKSAAA
jgi:hypothetical protein